MLGECALEPFGIDILGSQGKNACAKRGHSMCKCPGLFPRALPVGGEETGRGRAVADETGEASVRLHGCYKIITQASPTKILIQLEEGRVKGIFKNHPGKAARVGNH